MVHRNLLKMNRSDQWFTVLKNQMVGVGASLPEEIVSFLSYVKSQTTYILSDRWEIMLKSD